MSSLAPEKIADLRVKHLEMIQSIIARLAGYGATLKNYCVTLTTAVCGFSITSHKPMVAILAFLPIIVFALLDAQYLRVERQFRSFFDKLRKEDWNHVPSFDLNLNAAPSAPYLSALWSWSIFNFYAPLSLGVAVVVLAVQ